MVKLGWNGTHKLVGSATLAALLLSLLTGFYSRLHFPSSSQIPPSFDDILETHNLVLLVCGLLNVAVGQFLVSSGIIWKRLLQVAGSSLLVSSPILCLAGYFAQSWSISVALTAVAILPAAAGLLLHLLGGMRRKQ